MERIGICIGIGIGIGIGISKALGFALCGNV